MPSTMRRVRCHRAVWPRVRFAGLVVALATATAAQAAPITSRGSWWGTDGSNGSLQARDIGGNAVALNSPNAAFFYETSTNLTWLADMGLGGRRNWGAAMTWAGALTTGGFSDWRLPTTIDSGSPGCNEPANANGVDCGYNVLTQVDSAYSEWAHLYYVTLGNLAWCPASAPRGVACATGQTGWNVRNTAYFLGVQGSQYWSDTEYALGAGNAWRFNQVGGNQYAAPKTANYFAAAVRSGDVLNAVPEPQSLVLALTALAALGLGRRRKQDAQTAHG